MLYCEDYIIVNIGLVSNVNQDNIYANGMYLNEHNKGINNYKVKINRLNKDLIYAVFDGIGGLSQGEHASYIASNILSKNKDKNIDDIINKINDELLKYSSENNIKLGTTASIVKIENKSISVHQVGDSPVYLISDNKIIKLTEHNMLDNLLDNYLGSGKKIKISKYTKKIKNNDIFLICSDGLSKEVGINEIEYILKQSNNIKYIGDKLLNNALKSGGKDNISIVIIKFNKKYTEIILSILFALVLIIIIFIFK